MHLHQTDPWTLLLRQSYRLNGKVLKRTLINCTKFSDADKQLLGDLLTQFRKLKNSWLATDIRASIESLICKYPVPASKSSAAYTAIALLVEPEATKLPRLTNKPQAPEFTSAAKSFASLGYRLLPNNTLELL